MHSDSDKVPDAHATIDWDSWEPGMLATLLFVVDGDRVLLIRKKRGIGAGKINGPGGKIEPGETAMECAVRETIEEIGVRGINPEEFGELSFHFTDGLKLHCRVFVAREHEGSPIETDEAVPHWFPIAEIPYEEMWEDDQHWLPHVLIDQKRFSGRFIFDDEEMLWKDIAFSEPSAR